MAIIGDENKSKLLKEFVGEKMDSGFSILSSNIDVFMVIDMKGRIEYASKPSGVLLGYSTNHLLRLGLKNIFDKAILDEGQCFFKGIEKDKLNTFASKVIDINGNDIETTVTLFPILHKEHVIGFYVVLRCSPHVSVKQEDEEKYNALIDQLTQLSEKRATAGHLAAGIAHEIRNPITAIKGFLHLLKNGNAENKTYFGVIDSEIERIELILKELMILAKPNKQKYEMVDFQLLLDQVITLMEPQALLNNIHLQKNYHLIGPKLLGDSNQLKQVFINYIKNAIEAMPNGGNIHIKGCLLSDNSIEVCILDEGSGIPSELMNQVGEIFFTTKENGTGLGMLVSNQIVKEHKGTLMIESDKNGTCIRVRFRVDK
jgi:signal transduction histidine kinase